MAGACGGAAKARLCLECAGWCTVDTVWWAILEAGGLNAKFG